MTFLWLPIIYGNVIIPTDELIFFRGLETANQIYIYIIYMYVYIYYIIYIYILHSLYICIYIYVFFFNVIFQVELG